MKVTEALKILQRAPGSAPPFRVLLACGFTALHVETFLGAHLQNSLPARRVTIATGLFGDPAGTLEDFQDGAADAVVLALEWPDLDPRLGFRGAGTWGPASVEQMLVSGRAALARIAAAIENIPHETPVVVSLPTVPLAPVFHTPGWQTSNAELALQQILIDFAIRLAGRTGLSLVNSDRLAWDSPVPTRFDLKLDLFTGLPYTVSHADAVASALARLIAPPPPKKGLITDLDNTLWHGIVGEIGPDEVAWDLASHQQLHGLYQRLLGSLAEEGVLIAIASKNDPATVQQALQREDLLLPPARVFPIEVHWNAKSTSVERILQTWNIGADSVVFVDDSPMELAEVAAAHPGIECQLFPTGDPSAGYALLRRLRDLFGKPRLSEEDSIRLDSIRQGVVFRESADAGSAKELFLEQAGAVVSVEIGSSSADYRALELVNKTNQFNLNGIRCSASEWHARLLGPGAFGMVIGYEDKFGPLGKIAVLQGRLSGETVHIDTWVMSCRAFSRRIEHQCLKILFERSGAREIRFAFEATPRNGPFQDFAAAIAGFRPEQPFTLTRAQFDRECPALYHRITESPTSSGPWTQLQTA